jgi:MoaA/NifB/PqqE/SkfB family radical SAM enzyme
MTWGTKISFRIMNESDEKIREIIEWLEDKNIKHCVFYRYSGYGEHEIFTVLLPEENYKEAIYLSFFDGCIEISKENYD